MIKNSLKQIIVFLLKIEAKLILRKYKPRIIAIGGTVGKTSTKDATFAIFSSRANVRKSEKSYNSELGVPLTIIGAKSGWSNLFLWASNLIKGLKIIFRKEDYPKWLVLEVGVDRPGDMRRLMSWIKPDIAIMTVLGEIPVHVEYFKEPEDLIKEKSYLFKVLKEENYAIANADDSFFEKLKERTRAQIISFGFSEGADLKASNYRITYKKEGEKEIPEGITFKIEYQGNIVPVYIYNTFGKQAIYSALAGFAAGVAAGFNLIEMAESVSQYQSPSGRLKILEGIKNTLIIDDSYNSSPIAVRAAFELVGEVSAKRKIAVLGDMLELGKFTIDEHKKVGALAKKGVQILFTVGPRSKFTAEEARATGFNPKNIFEFSTSDEAKRELQKIMKEGDLILIKGSQSMRMEKITEEIMAHPEDKEKLLVRQEPEWQNR